MVKRFRSLAQCIVIRMVFGGRVPMGHSKRVFTSKTFGKVALRDFWL